MTVREDSMNKESLHKEEDSALDDIDHPMTVADNGRTIINRNTEQPEAAALGIMDVTERAGVNCSNQMDTTTIVQNDFASNKETEMESSTDGVMNAVDGDGDGDGDNENSAQMTELASAIKFQPLQPIAEKSLSPRPHQAQHDSTLVQDYASNQSGAVQASRESGSFMNNIQDPVAASKVFKKTQLDTDDENSSTHQMSHTPPTNLSTSYETMHFGKRPRSGVS